MWPQMHFLNLQSVLDYWLNGLNCTNILNLAVFFFMAMQHKFSKVKVVQLLVEVIYKLSGLTTIDSLGTFIVANSKVVVLVLQVSHPILEVPMVVPPLQVLEEVMVSIR